MLRGCRGESTIASTTALHPGRWHDHVHLVSTDICTVPPSFTTIALEPSAGAGWPRKHLVVNNAHAFGPVWTACPGNCLPLWLGDRFSIKDDTVLHRLSTNWSVASRKPNRGSTRGLGSSPAWPPRALIVAAAGGREDRPGVNRRPVDRQLGVLRLDVPTAS